jgi:hypothetical protein
MAGLLIFLAIVGLAVLLLFYYLCIFINAERRVVKCYQTKVMVLIALTWKKEVSTASSNSQNVEHKDKEIPTASNFQREQEKNDLTATNHTTLEDILRVV